MASTEHPIVIEGVAKLPRVASTASVLRVATKQALICPAALALLLAVEGALSTVPTWTRSVAKRANLFLAGGARVQDSSRATCFRLPPAEGRPGLSHLGSEPLNDSR